MIQHNGTEEGEWQYKLQCSDIPVMIILLVSIGAFFAIMLALLIAAIVIININDYRRYKQYIKQKEEAETALQDMQSPLFVDPNQTTMNPLHGK